MICPSCNGKTEILGIFPPVSIKCDACNQTGEVDENFKIRLERGRLLKEERRKQGLSLRDFCIKYKIDPVKYSKKERGLLSY